jgi:DNA-binding NarL/FixJ family response regulator
MNEYSADATARVLHDEASAARGAADATTRVYVGEHDEMLRHAIGRLLNSAPDIAVVGSSGTAVGTLRDAPKLAPNVVIVDANMRDGNGLVTCLRLRRELPRVRLLLHVCEARRYPARDARRSGVEYLLRQADPAYLPLAVRNSVTHFR